MFSLVLITLLFVQFYNRFRFQSSRLKIIDILVSRCMKKKRRKRNYRRSCWIQPELYPDIRSQYFEKVVPLYTDERFIKKFRISKQTYHFLCQTLHRRLYKRNTVFRDAISVGKRILVAISILKGNSDLWTIADLFGIGKSTVAAILHDFCLAVINEFYDKLVVFPTSVATMQEMADKFKKKWQFPGCIGALDGTHIPINAPPRNYKDYYNYKSFYSLVLMAVVDENYKFTYTNIGNPGSVNDASIFNKSALAKKMKNLIPLSLHIIADGIFPLLTWLMKPYLRSERGTGVRNTNPIQNNFNKRLSRARNTVEDAFGRLKGRWRILSKRIDFDVENTKIIIRACVVLHNLCETRKDLYLKKWTEESQHFQQKFPVFPPAEFTTMEASSLSKSKRNYLANKLFRDRYVFVA